MEIIPLIYEDLMKTRSAQNLTLFSRKEGNIQKLFCQCNAGIMISSSISNKSNEWARIKPYVNKPIVFYDKRIVSHNFSDPSTWTASDNSLYITKPDPGQKYILSHCIARFPKSLMIVPSNPLHYIIYLSPDGVSEAVETIHLIYNTTADLIRKTNVPMYMSPTNLPSMGVEEIVEINFMYADPYTLQGAPIIFRGNLNERIEIHLENHDPFRDINGDLLTQECVIMFNFKRTIDF